jgi:hypothetical protein
MALSIEQSVLEALRVLPLDRQAQVLDFVEFIKQKGQDPPPRQCLRTLWAKEMSNIERGEIDAVRRTLAQQFDREPSP